MMTRRRVLVIGGAGLVGRHLVRAFAGHDTVVTYHAVRTPGGVPLDITDATAVRAVLGHTRPDVVILAAAEPNVDRCEREPDSTRAVNVDAARPIAHFARQAVALLVVFSSDYVFDGTNGPYAEGATPQPLNEYGRQKVELEAIARSVPSHLICRTSGVFGWEPARKNFVCQLLDRLRAGRELIVPSDQQITPTYAVHLAHAIRRLVDRETTGTIHIAGPETVPREGFARRVCRMFDLDEALIVPRRTEEIGRAAERPRRAGLADLRLRGLLAAPLPSLAEALADMRATEGTQAGVPG